MDDSDKRLIKILNRERRELKAEVEYLKSMLWDFTHSSCEGDHPDDQIPEGFIFPQSEAEEPGRQEESMGPGMCDSLVRELLTSDEDIPSGKKS